MNLQGSPLIPLCVLVTQSCPALGNPIDCGPPGSMEFSRQEYWSGLPFSSPGDLPDPGIEPWSPALQADSLLSELPGKPFLTFKQGLTGAASQGCCES